MVIENEERLIDSFDEEEAEEERAENDPFVAIKSFEAAMDILGNISHMKLDQALKKEQGGISAKQLKELYLRAYPNKTNSIFKRKSRK